MGCYTKYRLEIISGLDSSIHYGEEITKLTDYNSLFDEPIKWYDHAEDLKYFSKKYPQTVFALFGEGDESGDLWVKYFKNGKMQYGEVEIIYPEYDENELKN